MMRHWDGDRFVEVDLEKLANPLQAPLWFLTSEWWNITIDTATPIYDALVKERQSA